MSVVIIDMKGSAELLDAARELALRHQLPFKFLSIEDRPGRAHWNPLTNGDHTVNKDRLLDVEEWSEPYYRGQCETALQNVLRLMAVTNTTATLATVHHHLDPANFRGWVAEADELGESERSELLGWMAAVAKDPKRLSAVRDMQSRLANMLASIVGPAIVPGPGMSINLLDDLDRGAVVVFSLSATSYPIEAERIAAWAARELNVVAAHRITTVTAADRRPTLLLVDEFHSAAAASSQIAMGFQMFREARITCAVACQSMLNLDALEPGDATQIKANARVTIANRDREGAEMIAQRFGTAEAWEPTMQTTQVGGVVNPTGEAATGTGSSRRVDAYVIHPNILRRLPDTHVVVHVAGSLDADGNPAMPKVCRVTPHHDHPLVDPLPKPAPTSSTADRRAVQVRVPWRIQVQRARRMLPSLAAAGGLLALIAIPVLFVRGDTGAPAAAAPVAIDATAGPEGWATAVMQAWVQPPGPMRDRQLQSLIGATLPQAPISAVSDPVATSVSRLGDERWLLTYLVTGDDGAVTGWAITVDGRPWTLRSAPVPVPTPATPIPVAAAAIDADAAASEQLAPVLGDFMRAWGRGGDGDTERLATLTSPGRTLRPVGGLNVVDADFVVSHARGRSRAVHAEVTWSPYGPASYLLELQADAAGTWKVASIQPWPGSITTDRYAAATSTTPATTGVPVPGTAAPPVTAAVATTMPETVAPHTTPPAAAGPSEPPTAGAASTPPPADAATSDQGANP